MEIRQYARRGIGGVIRDITVGVPSILMRHELYVSAALVASALFVGLSYTLLASPWPAVSGVAAGFALRGAAIRWNLSLPPHRGS